MIEAKLYTIKEVKLLIRKESSYSTDLIDDEKVVVALE
jgi:hypothetical protein